MNKRLSMAFLALVAAGFMATAAQAQGKHVKNRSHHSQLVPDALCVDCPDGGGGGGGGDDGGDDGGGDTGGGDTGGGDTGGGGGDTGGGGGDGTNGPDPVNVMPNQYGCAQIGSLSVCECNGGGCDDLSSSGACSGSIKRPSPWGADGYCTWKGPGR